MCREPAAYEPGNHTNWPAASGSASFVGIFLVILTVAGLVGGGVLFSGRVLASRSPGVTTLSVELGALAPGLCNILNPAVNIKLETNSSLKQFRVC